MVCLFDMAVMASLRLSAQMLPGHAAQPKFERPSVLVSTYSRCRLSTELTAGACNCRLVPDVTDCWVWCADGSAHGVVMMNSNGMDVVLDNDSLQFRMMGGIIDLYFLAGPTPNQVNDQLTQIIGRPVMPPYWAMGLMQSKCAPAPPLTFPSQLLKATLSLYTSNFLTAATLDSLSHGSFVSLTPGLLHRAFPFQCALVLGTQSMEHRGQAANARLLNLHMPVLSDVSGEGVVIACDSTELSHA